MMRFSKLGSVLIACGLVASSAAILIWLANWSRLAWPDPPHWDRLVPRFSEVYSTCLYQSEFVHIACPAGGMVHVILGVGLALTFLGVVVRLSATPSA